MEEFTSPKNEGVSMTFVSQSQAAQDRFAWEMCGRKTYGTFLDIGSHHPVNINNTYALEQMGLRGLGIDLDESSIAQSQGRKSPFIVADATKIDWNKELIHAAIPGFDWTTIDYVSLDVDEATPDALRNLLAHGIKFNVATIEHDFYRFGNGPRDEMRKLLKEQGYDLICADVKIRWPSTTPNAFEDWFCAPGFNPALADKLRCEGLEWSEIMKRI